MDAQYIKAFKFIKDPCDLKATLEVLRQYFVPLKEQFLNQIANPKFYPVISWLDYSAACSNWNVIDRQLTSQDIDRTFIATNYEEVDLENNDENSLCRYEFLEITARIGKIRYFEKGQSKTVAEATKRIIDQHILVCGSERMPWQEFRTDRLWCLEVDDLFKANKRALDALYRFTKTGGHTKDAKVLSSDDAVKMVALAGFDGAEHEKRVTLAYSLSKMTIIDEMGDFDNYNKMKHVEFLEFLGRLAELNYDGEQPLVVKLERLLEMLFSKIISMKVTYPDDEADIETDSDCVDDQVDEFKEQIL